MIEVKYWFMAVGILLLCLGLILGWRVGVVDGSTQVGRITCWEQGKDFIKLEKNFSVVCSVYDLNSANTMRGVLPFD